MWTPHVILTHLFFLLFSLPIPPLFISMQGRQLTGGGGRGAGVARGSRRERSPSVSVPPPLRHRLFPFFLLIIIILVVVASLEGGGQRAARNVNGEDGVGGEDKVELCVPHLEEVLGVELDELAAWLVKDALDEAPVLAEHLDHKATAWKSQKMCAWRWDTFIPPPRMPRSTVAVDVVHCHGRGGGAADAGMVPQPEPAMASPSATEAVAWGAAPWLRRRWEEGEGEGPCSGWPAAPRCSACSLTSFTSTARVPPTTCASSMPSRRSKLLVFVRVLGCYTADSNVYDLQ